MRFYWQMLYKIQVILNSSWVKKQKQKQNKKQKENKTKIMQTNKHLTLIYSVLFLAQCWRTRGMVYFTSIRSNLTPTYQYRYCIWAERSFVLLIIPKFSVKGNVHLQLDLILISRYCWYVPYMHT